MQSNKRNTLAVVAALQRKKRPAPTKDAVQQLKAIERTSIDDAITFFVPKIKDRLRDQLMHVAEPLAKTFKRKGDAWLRTAHPDLHELWNNGAPPAFSGGNQGAVYHLSLKDLTGKPALLARLNLLRRKRGMDVLTSVKGSKEDLLERIKKLEQSIIADSVSTFPILPTAVAEGAYRSQEEAVAKTAHTMRGKSKSQEKHEKRVAKHIDKRIKASDVSDISMVEMRGDDLRKALQGKPVKGSNKLSPVVILTLADIARELKMLPKVARQKARKHKKELGKLETSGKYKYDPKSKAKVVAILRGGA